MQIYLENPRKVMQNKDLIERKLNIKIKRQGDFINIESTPENEFLAIRVFEAINLGFKVPEALTLKEEGMEFEKINIKALIKRKDLWRVKGRIIGKNGKVLAVIKTLTECDVVVKGSEVGIIGKAEDIKHAAEAIEKIAAGSKHAKVYASLEKERAAKKQSF